jgi:hypothetical protein
MDHVVRSGLLLFLAFGAYQTGDYGSSYIIAAIAVCYLFT